MSVAQIRLLFLAVRLALPRRVCDKSRPAVPVDDHRAVDERSNRDCERSSHASCLPIFPNRPDQIRIDDSLCDCGCDADGEVQDPESRFEDLETQESPWVQGADEPQADFCRGEKDADEDEG